MFADNLPVDKAPRAWRTAASLFILVFIISCIFAASLCLVTRQPALGISFAAGSDGLEITTTQLQTSHSASPSGSTVIGIRPAFSDAQWYALEPGDLLRQPDRLETFAGFNQFADRQSAIYRLLKNNNSLELKFSDASTTIVQVAPYRSIFTLPPRYWFYLGSGLLSAVLALSVWYFRHNHALGGWLYAIAGCGYALIAASHGVYAARELAIEGELLRVLTLITHFGALAMATSMLLMSVSVPRQLLSQRGVILSAAVACTFWGNLWLQWTELPLHSFYFPFLVAIVIGIPCCVYQFVISKRWQGALGYRALYLLLASLVGAAFSMYFLPLSIGANALLTDTGMLACLLLFFLGLFIVCLKFDLFRMRDWIMPFPWIVLYSLLPAATVIFAIERYNAGHGVWSSLLPSVVALALGAFLYTWSTSGLRSRRNLFVRLNAALESNPAADLASIWRDTLVELFRPGKIEARASVPHEHIVDRGSGMLCRDITGSGGVLLSGKSSGATLFHQEDLDMARAAREFLDRCARLSSRYQHALAEERRRVSRELHDDFAPKLVSIRNAVDLAQVADLSGQMVEHLREVIYSLNDENEFELQRLLERWEAEARMRLSAAHISLQWDMQQSGGSAIRIEPIVWRHLARIFSELVSNVIRHSGANYLVVRTDQSPGQLLFIASDDGNGPSPPATWRSGMGIKAIVQRAEEIGATTDWFANPCAESQFPGGCTFVLRLPLHGG